MSQTVVVSGGSGFIGSKIARAALERGYEVVSLDKVPGVDSDVDSRICDISDSEQLARQFPKQPTAIFHFAARTSVLESKLDPEGVFATNVLGTHNLLELARTRSVDSFLFASTNAIVGEAESIAINESNLLAPLTPYGASKAAGEMLMSAYLGSYDIATCAIRLTNVYGPNMFKKDSIIPRIMRALLGGNPLEIYGDGKQWRDFIFSQDVVDAFFLALEQRVVGALTIGAGQSYTVAEIVETVEAVAGRSVPTIHGPARAGEMRGVQVDITRARSLGFEPKIDLVAGVGAVWQDYLDQQTR